jgi:hypothetical protein
LIPNIYKILYHSFLVIIQGVALGEDGSPVIDPLFKCKDQIMYVYMEIETYSRTNCLAIKFDFVHVPESREISFARRV